MKLKRNYYILKCRFHVWRNILFENLFIKLSKLGLLVEHKRSYQQVRDQIAPVPAPDFENERSVFEVSYTTYTIDFASEYWFESKKGKKLLTLYDEHHTERIVEYRANLKSFLAHFSHKQKIWVHAKSPKVALKSDGGIRFYEHFCDFSQCRFAFKFKAPLDSKTTLREVIAESYRVFGDTILSNTTNINRLLTGVDFDGVMMSPSKRPLVDNIICKECGFPVFSSSRYKYQFECIHHGEIKFEDCLKVDPVKYEEIFNNCVFELERFCECPQD